MTHPGSLLTKEDFMSLFCSLETDYCYLILLPVSESLQAASLPSRLLYWVLTLSPDAWFFQSYRGGT